MSGNVWCSGELSPVTRYQREHPRAAAELTAEIHRADGRRRFAQTVDISRAGVQVVADRATREFVFPAGQPSDPADRPRVMLRLRLPGSPDATWIRVDAEGVLFRRMGENDYRLGIQFLRFDDDGYEQLERFIIVGETRA